MGTTTMKQESNESNNNPNADAHESVITSLEILPKPRSDEFQTPISKDQEEPVKKNKNSAASTIFNAPEIGPGWTYITKARKKSGAAYKYFITPKQKFSLRSRPAVQRFLEALAIEGGDEAKAYASLRRSDKRFSGNAANGKGRTTATDAGITNPNRLVAKGKISASLTKAKAVPKKKQRPNPPKQATDHDPLPKKPPSTFLMHTSKMRQNMMEENPGANPQEISKIQGGIWRDLSVVEKDKLKVTYRKDRQLQNPCKKAKIRDKEKNIKKKRVRPPPPAAKATPPPTQFLKKPRHEKDLPAGTSWWEVEDFRDRRINRQTGNEEYLIKWRGYSESNNTWEPSSSLNVQDEAKAWWEAEKVRRKTLAAKQKRIRESTNRLELTNGSWTGEFDEMENDKAEITEKKPTSKHRIVYQGSQAPTDANKSSRALLEDDTWEWDDASQINFRRVQRISIHDPSARELVTEARINGTPVVLVGHVGWANFALRWLRRKESVKDKKSCDRGNMGKGNSHTVCVDGKVSAVSMQLSKIEKTTAGDNQASAEEITDHDSVSCDKENNSALSRILSGTAINHIGDPKSIMKTAMSVGNCDKRRKKCTNEKSIESLQSHKVEKKRLIVRTFQSEKNDESHTTVRGSCKLLDLSDPGWYLDVEAMSRDIGNEEVPVVRKNYNESKPISGNISASKFFEVGWKTEEQDSSKKRRQPMLYLHQWQFPLSVEAYKKLCHQSVPLPNNILGEDLLKYWLDRVKLDCPLQYLFMGNADTMSKIHKDNGGLAISIAPIIGEKECILVHRDDGQACLYNNQASLDADDIDLNSYPLLPHARIWKSTIKPGEILLLPHGTYHQCRNVSPCLSYSRFHLDGVNLRAFLQSMMDGDAPELDQDVVLWNATRELIDVVDNASDEKRKVDQELFKAVDALRSLRHIAKEVTRKLRIRETVKGIKPSSNAISSSIRIDGDAETWQSLVDDVDMCLHEFRYRFNGKIPPFKGRRSIGRKILALPSLPFRGKSKLSDKEITQGKNEPVVAFECPADRGFLALPKAPLEVFQEQREKVDNAINFIAEGDEIEVRIEGRKCPARVTEVMAYARAAWVSFEDLPSLYNDYVACDLLRTPSVGGSCLTEPPPEAIKPGQLFVCLMGKEEYRGVIQYIKCGRFFKSELDFGNGYSFDRLVDPESILSVTRHPEKTAQNSLKGIECKKRKHETSQTATHSKKFENDLKPIPDIEKEIAEAEGERNSSPKSKWPLGIFD